MRSAGRDVNLAGYAFGRREAFGAALGRLVPLVIQGNIRLDIERVPLAKAADAHLRLEGRNSLGKMVLKPWD
jgi:NADPH:quinone reductase-like Zn-dependent oxidoreductase